MKILKRGAIIFIIINLFFQAPLRFLFSFVLRADSLNYSFNIILVLSMIIFKRKQILNAFNKYSWIFAYLIILALYSAMFESYIMIFFFIYMIIPFFFYILYYNEILDFIHTSDKFFIIVLILSSAGLIYDYYFDFPWKSLTYKIDGKDVELAKDWMSDGVERVAGFYRSSYDAAMGILFLAILVIYKSKNIIFHHLIFVITFVSIYITTTKGCLVSVLLVYVVYLLQFVNKIFAKTAIKFMVFILCVLLVFLPLGIFQNLHVPFLNNASLLDRINNEWPFLMGQFKRFTDYVLGLGVGAVGLPQRIYGNSNIYSPADNFFIYMYGNFGIAVFIIFKLIYSRLKKFDNLLFIYMLVFLLSWGITTNTVEAPLGQLLIAFSLFMSFNTSGKQMDEADISLNEYSYDLHKL